MISKAKIKFLRALREKKYRELHKSFLAEGEKNFSELIASEWKPQMVYCTKEFHSHNKKLFQNHETTILESPDIEKISLLETAPPVICEMKMKETQLTPENKYQTISELIRHPHTIVVLDGIRDPGNLGTIVRIADWYGVKYILCSSDCVELYNPKAIQSSMGSFVRVHVWYGELKDILPKIIPDKKIYAGVLQGENLHQKKLDPNSLLLIGNEAHGIRQEILEAKNLSGKITRISIPRFGKAESLNAAVSCAVMLDALSRR